MFTFDLVLRSHLAVVVRVPEVLFGGPLQTLFHHALHLNLGMPFLDLNLLLDLTVHLTHQAGVRLLLLDLCAVVLELMQVARGSCLLDRL